MLFRLMDSEAVIINEVVINEVRSRECLWNPRNVYYKNKTYKYKAWEEVSIAVLPKYTTCSEEDKRRILRAVQSRWKTAHEAYMKCRLKNPTHKARQQRFIYNKLKFLEQVKELDEGVKDVSEDIAEGVNDRVQYDEAGSNSFVGDNPASQATSTVCDDDDSEGSDKIMDYDIDIHDDFKEKIKHLVTAIDGGDDKAVNDNITQESLPGTSSQNNDIREPLATANVTIPQKNCTSAKTPVLQTDDQLFFNTLAPLIDNFDIHQKLMLRSKIMDLVKEIGNIGPVKIKQEKET